MLLLDTHVVIWALSEKHRLGPRTTGQLVDSGSVYYSAASVLEMNIKSMLGKLRMPADLEELASERRFRPLPVSVAHAMALRDFPDLVEHDPFDRALVAQAHVDRLNLVTADDVLLSLNLPFILDARL